MERIETGYEPRRHQKVLHASLKRFNIIVCHRRFGKTVWSINEMIDQGLRCDLKNPQYAYIAPTYAQAKRTAWEYLKDYTRKLPGYTAHEQELRVDIKRPWRGDKVRYMLLSAEKPDSLRGIYLDGVLLDEYADCDPIVWSQVVRPALSDRKGWAIFIGTPKGRNHFFDIYQVANKSDDWYRCIFKASETRILDEKELEAAQMTMTEEEYLQEYECSFQAALVGAYYGSALDKVEAKNQITSVMFDPSVPVDTYWDLGISDTTAIWFAQQVGREVHLIDYLEDSGIGLQEYADKLKKGHRADYVYGEHWLPHDGAARELGTGRSRQETLLKHGIKTNILPRHKLEDGINASRLLIPRCWFDTIKCERGLNALRNYERKWDSKNKIFSSRPLHNWASHGADAFRTMAMGMKEDHQKTDISTLPRVAPDFDYDIFGVG